jgi:hypothetical protein
MGAWKHWRDPATGVEYTLNRTGGGSWVVLSVNHDPRRQSAWAWSTNAPSGRSRRRSVLAALFMACRTTRHSRNELSPKREPLTDC